MEERDNITVKSAGGINFAFLAYTFGTNGQPIPSGREYLVNMLNMALIEQDIAKARQLADFVIVLPHMGNEYEEFVRPEFKERAMRMLSAGADIVIAGHPHVVQPLGFVMVTEGEAYRRGFVAYCLGNFVSSQRIIPRETGLILNMYFSNDFVNPPTLDEVEAVPIRTKFTNSAGQLDIRVLPIRNN
jgi:poly-gamma-glutamate synthesis protein (capsule biosynthesis protein)